MVQEEERETEAEVSELHWSSERQRKVSETTRWGKNQWNHFISSRYDIQLLSFEIIGKTKLLNCYQTWIIANGLW
jgi:hypothetical protein